MLIGWLEVSSGMRAGRVHGDHCTSLVVPGAIAAEPFAAVMAPAPHPFVWFAFCTLAMRYEGDELHY
jgi:hypothetical protein